MRGPHWGTALLVGAAVVAGSVVAVTGPAPAIGPETGPAPLGAELAATSEARAGDGARAGAAQAYENPAYDSRYHFVRLRWERGERGGFFGRGRGRGALWAHDYPRAEQNFLKMLDHFTFVAPLTAGSQVVTLEDPELFNHPIAYIVEVGFWNPSDEEIANLGEYLLKGGFLIVDDFRDERGCCPGLDNVRFHLERALPGLTMVELDETHEVFDSFFRVVPQDVIPPYGPRNPTWFGVYEDNDPTRRLLAVINYNNDIAEYWEYSDYGYLAVDLANEAYKLGINYVVYGLTH